MRARVVRVEHTDFCAFGPLNIAGGNREFVKVTLTMMTTCEEMASIMALGCKGHHVHCRARS